MRIGMNAEQPGFEDLCRRIELPAGTVAKTWNLLERRYSEPHRAYHNLDHIDHMLSCLKALGVSDERLELAIWFHDVVYDPTATDNEKASAMLFEEKLGSFLSPEFCGDVMRLVLATDPGTERTGEPGEDLIVDIDLSILSMDWDFYDAYRAGIRKEYAHVPDDLFAVGRTEILRSLMAQDVYATAHFKKLETAAKANMNREIALLMSI